MKLKTNLWKIGLLVVLMASTAWGQTGDKFPISVWYHLGANEARVLESMLTEYQSTHPYVHVSWKNFTSDEALYRALTGGGPTPTLAIMETSWLPHVSAKGQLMSVEDWMPRDKFLFSWSVKHDVYKPLFAASSVGDRLMARPMFFTTKALIYNTELFAEGKVTAPPATWDQLKVVAQKVAKPELGVFGFHLAPNSNPRQMARGLQILAWQAGSELVTSAGRSSSTAGLDQALALLAELNGLTPDPSSGINPRQVAMFPGTVADVLALRQAGIPVKAASLPGPTKSSRTTELQAWSLGMFRVDEAQLYKVQEIAFFLLDFNQQRIWAEKTPYLAAHVKVFDNPFYRRERLADHSVLRVFVNILGRSKPVDTAGRANAALDALGKEIPGYLRGDKSSARGGAPLPVGAH